MGNDLKRPRIALSFYIHNIIMATIQNYKKIKITPSEDGGYCCCCSTVQGFKSITNTVVLQFSTRAL